MKCFFATLVCATTVAGLCFVGSANQTAPDLRKFSEQLRQGEEQAKTALEAFHAERTEAITILTSFVSENAMKDQEKPIVHEVVKTLGRLRAPEAIDALWNNVLFTPYVQALRPAPADVWYPCVGALIKIGDPVIPRMVDILARERSDTKKSELGREIIENILGGGKNTSWNDRKGKVVAKALLEEEVRIRTDESQKQRLQKVIKELEQAIQEIK